MGQRLQGVNPPTGGQHKKPAVTIALHATETFSTPGIDRDRKEGNGKFYQARRPVGDVTFELQHIPAFHPVASHAISVFHYSLEHVQHFDARMLEKGKYLGALGEGYE
jgi:hypothetical protein